METQVRRAVLELGIDVPVLKASAAGPCLVLYLYGGGVRKWCPSSVPAGTEDGHERARAGEARARMTPWREERGVDFSVVPGVGDATTRALHRAGYLTWDDVAAAPDAALRRLVQIPILAKLRAYIDERPR